MLLPRFKLRTALIWFTAAAFLSLLFREGAQGTGWAIGASIGIASLFLWLLLMAFFYLATLLFRPRASYVAERNGKGSIYASAPTNTSATPLKPQVAGGLNSSEKILDDDSHRDQNAVGESVDKNASDQVASRAGGTRLE